MSVLTSYLSRKTMVILYTTGVDEEEVRIHKFSWQSSHLGGRSRAQMLWDEGGVPGADRDPKARGRMVNRAP